MCTNKARQWTKASIFYHIGTNSYISVTYMNQLISLIGKEYGTYSIWEEESIRFGLLDWIYPGIAIKVNDAVISLNRCRLKEEFLLVLVLNHKSSWSSKMWVNMYLDFIYHGLCIMAMFYALTLFETCFLTQLPFTSLCPMQHKVENIIVSV